MLDRQDEYIQRLLAARTAPCASHDDLTYESRYRGLLGCALIRKPSITFCMFYSSYLENSCNWGRRIGLWRTMLNSFVQHNKSLFRFLILEVQWNLFLGQLITFWSTIDRTSSLSSRTLEYFIQKKEKKNTWILSVCFGWDTKYKNFLDYFLQDLVICVFPLYIF